MQTGPDGSAEAILWYHGLDWSSWQQALFKLECVVVRKVGEPIESEPVKLVVNVAQNVRDLLATLVKGAESLHLNNPYYEDPRWGLTDIVALTTFRAPMRGPIWNFCTSLSGQEAASQSKDKKIAWKAKFARDYVCSEYRDRIARWLMARRNYRPGQPDHVDMMSRMNGIEFDHFFLGGELGALHNFEAIFLSGMEPEEDPQEWTSVAYADPDGLITANFGRIYSAEFVAWANAVGIPVVAGLVLSGWGGSLAVVTTALLELVAAYTLVSGVSVNKDSVYSLAKGYQFYAFGKAALPYVGREQFVGDWVAANPSG